MVRPFFLPPRVKLLDTLQGEEPTDGGSERETIVDTDTRTAIARERRRRRGKRRKELLGTMLRTLQIRQNIPLSFPPPRPPGLPSSSCALFIAGELFQCHLSIPLLLSSPHPPFPSLYLISLLLAVPGDPQQRFVILGFGNDTRVMMRDFRVDEPEIEEFIEHWRRLIASKSTFKYGRTPRHIIPYHTVSYYMTSCWIISHYIILHHII